VCLETLLLLELLGLRAWQRTLLDCFRVEVSDDCLESVCKKAKSCRGGFRTVFDQTAPKKQALTLITRDDKLTRVNSIRV
jgi:hypothetical protein